MTPVPYTLGLLVLSAALLTVALVEWALRGREATRWREYLVLLVLAGLGAGFGAAIDSVTVRLSPDYFALGKGLGYRPDLPTAAILLGAEAGSAAGVVLGCLYLFAATAGGGPRAGFVDLFRAILWPLLLAGATALLLGLAFGHLARQGVAPEVAGLPEARRVAFTMVWGIHIGVYLGGAVGALVGAGTLLARRGGSPRAWIAGSIPFRTRNRSRPRAGCG